MLQQSLRHLSLTTTFICLGLTSAAVRLAAAAVFVPSTPCFPLHQLNHSSGPQHCRNSSQAISLHELQPAISR